MPVPTPPMLHDFDNNHSSFPLTLLKEWKKHGYSRVLVWSTEDSPVSIPYTKERRKGAAMRTLASERQQGCVTAPRAGCEDST